MATAITLSPDNLSLRLRHKYTDSEQLRLEPQGYPIAFADAQRTTEISESLFAGPRGAHTIIEASLATLEFGDELTEHDDVDLELRWFAMRDGSEASSGEARLLVPIGALEAMADLLVRLAERARQNGDLPAAGRHL
jgi:hypothetical protein